MKKRAVMLSLSFLLLLSVLLCSPFTLSWFGRGDGTGVDFELLEINSTVTLYRGVDSNQNGVPDRAAAPVSMKYYEEIYEFTDPVSDFALSEGTHTETKLSLSVAGLLPGQSATYKFVLENNSDAENEIHMALDFGSLSAASDARLLRALSVEVIPIAHGEDTYTLDFSAAAKAFLMDGLSAGSLDFAASHLPGLVAASQSGDGTANCLDFWFRVRLEPREALNAHIRAQNETLAAGETPADEIGETEYNALAGLAVENLLFRIYFDVVL